MKQQSNMSEFPFTMRNFKCKIFCDGERIQCFFLNGLFGDHCILIAYIDSISINHFDNLSMSTHKKRSNTLNLLSVSQNASLQFASISWWFLIIHSIFSINGQVVFRIRFYLEERWWPPAFSKLPWSNFQ